MTCLRIIGSYLRKMYLLGFLIGFLRAKYVYPVLAVETSRIITERTALPMERGEKRIHGRSRNAEREKEPVYFFYFTLHVLLRILFLTHIHR